MLGRQLRRTLLLEKQQQRNSIGKTYFSSSQSKQNEIQTNNRIKQLTSQVKRLLGVILEYELLEKESFILQPGKIRENVRELEGKRKLDEISLKFDEENEHRWMRITYLSFWRELVPFQESLYNTLDRITEKYQNQLKTRSFSIAQLYTSIVSLLIEKITKTRNKILETCCRNFKISKIELEQNKTVKIEPLKLKQVEKILKKTIYQGINLDKIDVLTYYIDGLEIKDNVDIIFQKQAERNKRAKKDVKQYKKKYHDREYRIRSRSHPQRTHPPPQIHHNTNQAEQQHQPFTRSASTASSTKKKKSNHQERNNPNRIVLKPIQNLARSTMPKSKNHKLKLNKK